MTANPPTAPVPPATFGCCHGSGLLGWAIRRAELEMTESAQYPEGDAEASWAGHCVVAVPDHDFGRGPEPAIVQAEWPRVVLSPASAHADTVWAAGQTLTAEQRRIGTSKALAMVGEHYDPLVYAWYAAKVLGVVLSRDLTPLFTDPRWVICSGVVVVVQEAMGVDVSKLSTAATADPDFTCPADCMRWGLDNGWMRRAAPPAGGSTR